MTHLIIKTIGSREELQAAQRLRFEVFNREMNSGLKTSEAAGLDQDAFDDDCDHLIVKDEKKGAVVGTYRLLRGEKAREGKGFYSEQEFDLSAVKRLDGELLEVGRSCIHKDYRKKSVLNLLWQGIAQYAKTYKVRFIFGCASIFTVDPAEVSEIYHALKTGGYMGDVPVMPKDKRNQTKIQGKNPSSSFEDVLAKLPTLFQGYLTIGIKVCGQPVLDPEFGTTDFFILLDICHMNKAYKKRLFGDYLVSHGQDGTIEQRPKER